MAGQPGQVSRKTTLFQVVGESAQAGAGNIIVQLYAADF